MIGIIRARIDTEPNAPVWTDQQWQTFMDPTAQYSLAHFWRTCSFGLADLSFRLIPAVTITDPKPMMTAEQLNADPGARKARVQAITKAVDDRYKPDWGAFSTLLISFASPLDLWGSSAFDHGYGQSGVMVCDIKSKFDQLCHELGHTLGFEHPFGRDGVEYKSAYDIMGGYASEWIRPSAIGFPVGRAADGSDPLLRVGPMISAAQLSTSEYRARLPGLFNELTPGVQSSPVDVQLSALDAGADSWPHPFGSIAAILPADPLSPNNHYVIELRRSRGYDAGMRSAALPSNPPPGVVVHGYDRAAKRFHFAGALPLSSNLGDQDLHVFSGLPGSDFTVRLLEVGADDAWVRIRVGGPNYWRNFGVDVDIEGQPGSPEYTAWRELKVKPCAFAPTGTHSYRYRTARQTYTVDARSFGYEAPSYIWMLEGATLKESEHSVTVDVQTSVPDPLNGWEGRKQLVTFTYSLNGAHLEIDEALGDPVTLGKFSLLLEVTVNESSPGVLKNVYPERSVTTRLPYHTAEIEWDESYRQQLKHCEQVIDEVNRKRIPVPIPHRPSGRPDDDLPNILDVVASLIEVNPILANALIEQVGRTANIPTLEVIKRLQSSR